jgi:hypothetical protein
MQPVPETVTKEIDRDIYRSAQIVRAMRAELRYLRWIALHKLYVFCAGVAIARTMGSMYERPRTYWLALLWRLVRHDLSKLRPGEFLAYRRQFYPSETPTQWIERKANRIWVTLVSSGVVPSEASTRSRSLAESHWGKEKANRKAAFDRAWLKHIHRNDHHWQHWLLQQDDGRKIALIPPAIAVDEMIADWMGAGSKINDLPTLTECVAMTIAWYGANRQLMELRAPVRARVEETLLALGQRYGLADLVVMMQQQRAQSAAATITIPGRPVRA